MKALLVAVCAAGLVLSVSSGVARAEPMTAASDGARRGCVTIKEFRAVKQRMSIRKVRRVFGTTGHRIFAPRNPGTARYSTREYRTCARPKRGALTVDFLNGRLMDKFILWTRTKRDSARCVTNREFRRVRKGMRPRRVHRIFDTAGGFVDGFAGGYARGYERCRGKHVVITYVARGRKYVPRVFDKRFTYIPRR